MSEIMLYGSPLSLYTGRARSYLIKAGLAYREITPITPHYAREVVPKAGGRQGIPTIETAEGDVIRDGAAIIDHYESRSSHAFSPVTAKQRILSRLFDAIGAEGLLRPAMHYRWNFNKENLEFLKFHFETMVPPGPGRAEKAEAGADRMRMACQAFGAVPETFELVETLYTELLHKLDVHLAEVPYLLGGKPCIGDFGMIAPLYGHLGRDPRPLALMQAESIRVFRWVERMNRPEPDVGEFEVQDDEYLSDDRVPDSLIAVLQHLAIDFVPETVAAAECINNWIDQQSELAPGTEAIRGVGQSEFEVRGAGLRALAQPYRFYLLQRVQEEYASLNEGDRGEVDDMMAASNMTPILTTTLSRRLKRENNLEVWGE